MTELALLHFDEEAFEQARVLDARLDQFGSMSSRRLLLCGLVAHHFSDEARAQDCYAAMKKRYPRTDDAKRLGDSSRSEHERIRRSTRRDQRWTPASKARMEKKLSQVQVAEKLFLTTQIIECLDDGAFERIPKKAFIRGYIRAYARVVGLEGSELVLRMTLKWGATRGKDEATILMNAEDPSLAKTPYSGLAQWGSRC